MHHTPVCHLWNQYQGSLLLHLISHAQNSIPRTDVAAAIDDDEVHVALAIIIVSPPHRVLFPAVGVFSI